MKSEKEEKSFNHQILLEANYNDMLQNLDTERMNENWELTLLLQCGAVNANEVKERGPKYWQERRIKERGCQPRNRL